ncbi:MAG TPA: helix-turn-helix domain-containing protein [Urbifossiella sp.]|jgi:excisionase family DNA binding protein|nr:helix-turn-helix domain-containing protein [Urbifossiella sp.]
MCEMLTRRQAAARLGISVATLDRLTRAGHIRAVKIGPRTVRYEPGAVEACKRPTGVCPDAGVFLNPNPKETTGE